MAAKSRSNASTMLTLATVGDTKGAWSLSTSVALALATTPTASSEELTRRRRRLSRPGPGLAASPRRQWEKVNGKSFVGRCRQSRGCSTSANSTSASWPKSNWPKSNLAEVEQMVFAFFLLFLLFLIFFFIFSVFVFLFSPQTLRPQTPLP